MVDFLLEMGGWLLLKPILWGVLLPISWIVSTPVILVLALLQKGTYRQNVRAGYRKVFEFWEAMLTEIG